MTRGLNDLNFNNIETIISTIPILLFIPLIETSFRNGYSKWNVNIEK